MSFNYITEFDYNQIRQTIDAESTYLAWRRARADLLEVRGTMFWREQDGRTYLIRRSTSGAQKSLGPQSEETDAILRRFTARKESAQDREKSLRAQVDLHRRMNRALGLGRISPTAVAVINALDQQGVAEQFRVVGTYALFAYAAAARVHLAPSATATLDVDFLLDMRKRLSFLRTMGQANQSLLGLLQQVDPSFRLRDGQRCTAANGAGFEVDVIRRMVAEDDPHPLRVTDQGEDDFWAVQAPMGSTLQDGGLMQQVVIATDGRMALMRTVAPDVFCRVKAAIAKRSDRDPGKARRDHMQVQLVTDLVRGYLPQWSVPMSASQPPTE